MVLLGEQEELNYRLLRRSYVECFSAAPVAGLQSYMHSNVQLFDIVGREYISPYGGKKAPCRNMRVDLSIKLRDLLKDGRYLCYAIDNKSQLTQSAFKLRYLFLTTFSWVFFAGIVVFLAMGWGNGDATDDQIRVTSWIGIANCAIYSGWSIILRLLEHACVEPVVVKPSSPDDPDAVIFLGRRNSCLVLEGSRGDIAKYTGAGLQPKESPIANLAEVVMRLGSLLVILFVFVSIPNGTTWDQIAFIALNVLGQLNVVVGQRINASYCETFRHPNEKKDAETRTDIYAFLIRKFGNGKWVDTAGFIPDTEIWIQWRKAIDADPNKHKNNPLDPKQEYERIKKRVETPTGKRTDWLVQGPLY